MLGVVVESGGKTACYISDLIPTSAHLEVTWVMAFDLFPLDTIASRRRYYERALPENWLTVFTHDDRVPWAYVERVENKLIAREPG
jgi:glyoxylase-like metal-dependent hydrolase (beta-lactamase superfamily II)